MAAMNNMTDSAYNYLASPPVGSPVAGARIVFKAERAVWVEVGGETRVVRAP